MIYAVSALRVCGDFRPVHAVQYRSLKLLTLISLAFMSSHPESSPGLPPGSASSTATQTNVSQSLQFTTATPGQGISGMRTYNYPRPDVSLLRIQEFPQPNPSRDELRPTLVRGSCTEGKAHYSLHFLLTGPGSSISPFNDGDIKAAQIPASHIAELFGSAEWTRRAHGTADRDEEDVITAEAFDKLKDVVDETRQTHDDLLPLNTTVYEEIRSQFIHSCGREWERTDGATE